jgi:DNA-binding GntR family transcriptional regulator
MSKVVYNINRDSLSDRVYSYIKSLILSGELGAGERVPEVQVAQRFGVSRTPIREALKRLEEYGLIDVKPRSYAQVVRLAPEEARDVAVVRAALEVLAAALLAERGTAEDFDALERIAQECESSFQNGDVGRAFEKDSELHLEMARRSNNRHLYDHMEKLDAKIQLLRLILHLPKKQLANFIHQHRDILAALRAHDVSRAKQIMEAHILDQLDHYQPVDGRQNG